LASDVRVEGTAFVVGAKNVKLDLNGHTVTYGDSPPVVVLNGGFEEGDQASLPGWDLREAPGARRVKARSGMWGERMLEIRRGTEKQAILSVPVPIPRPGHEYAAAVTPKASPGSTVTLSVVDAGTMAVLAKGTSDNPDNGAVAKAVFTPGPGTKAVRLRIEMAPPKGASAYFALDNVAVTPSRDYGILASPNAWSLPAHLNNDTVKE